MTVAASIPRQRYEGNDVATVFSFPHRFDDEGDLLLIQRLLVNETDTTLVLTTDYTVSGVGTATGSVTLLTALPSGERLTIVRRQDLNRLTDMVRSFFFNPLNLDGDAQLMMIQELQEQISRAALQTISNTDVIPTLEAVLATVGDGLHSSLGNLGYEASGHTNFTGWTFTVGPPVLIPSSLGQIAIDPVNGLAYISVGATAADWLLATDKVDVITINLKSAAVLEIGFKNVIAKVKCNGTFFKATMISMLNGVETSGDLDVEVYKNGGKITASEPISLSGASEVDNTTLTGWVKTFVTNDKFTFKVVGTPAIVQNVDIFLYYIKTGV